MMRHSLPAFAATLLAITLSAHAAGEEAPYLNQIGERMEQGDYAGAKAAVVDMEKHGVHSMLAPRIENLDICLRAGKGVVTAAERKAIDADRRNGDTFSPDDDLKAATAFANGWGVPVNRLKATALVCRSGELSRAEWDDIVAFLGKADHTEEFFFCDHITSGIHGGQCATFDEDKVQTVRDRKLAALTAQFTPAQKAAFVALSKATEAYIGAHAGDEQDMSGTLRGAFYTEESGTFHEEFFKAIDGFEHGKRPPKGDFAEADKTLNKAYRALLTSTDWSTTGTVTADGVRKTQRLWIKCRDAWAAFGTTRYPGTSADDWKAWATRARIATLQAGFGPHE